MGTWTYVYDDGGYLAAQVDARGVTTTLGYDPLGRVITKTYTIPTGTPVAETEPVYYGYTGGLRTSMRDGSGRTIWEYDPAGRLLAETKTIQGYTFHTGYTYDAFGRLATMTYPDGEVVSYTYSLEDGQLTGVSGQDVYLADAVYNPLGQPTTWAVGGVVTQTLAYDPVTFRPATATTDDSTLQDLEFFFDNLGRLDWWSDTHLVATQYLNPDYDPLGRLQTVASNAYPAQSYAYDELGNLTGRSGVVTYTLAYDDMRPHLPITDSYGAVYEYDANGNLITRTVGVSETIVYVYDAENRLTKVISDSGAIPLITRFAYDGDAVLVMKEWDDGRIRYVGDYYMTDGMPAVMTPSWITTTNPSLSASNSVIHIDLENTGDFASVGGGGSPFTYLGINMFPYDTNNDSIEDWGVADTFSGVSGFSDIYGNLNIVRFAGTVDEQAISSIVRLETVLEIDHDFHPSPTANLYEITVSITNTSESAVNLLYRRTAHWIDNGENYGEAYITIGGTAINDEISAAVIPIPPIPYPPAYTYPSADPLITPFDATWGDVNDYGPGDFATFFDFDFGLLGPGETKRFSLYYGAADDEAMALATLDFIGAKAYALAQPATDPVNGTTFIFAYGDYKPPVSGTKHYFAGGQQLAMRLADGDLYYHLNDPTGTSLVLVDGNGDETGRMVYDGYGMALTNTLPLTLTGALAGHPDAVTGLVHLGGGRWYDPALGRPLQPNPMGGPPTLPQALNRYTATALGQPGVAAAAQGDAFNWTPHAVGLAKNTAVELARDISVITGYTYEGIRRIAVRGSYQTLMQNLPDALQEFPGRLVGSDPEAMFYLTRIRVQADTPLQIGVRARQLAQELTEGLPDGSLVQMRGGLSGYGPTIADVKWGQLDEVTRLDFIRTGIGFGLDFAIGFGFQYWGDSQNPYLTPKQVVLRSTVAGGGGAILSAAASLAFCGTTGGVGCLVLAGTGGGIIWSVAQPYVFEMIPGIHLTRNLSPITP